jgi:hypothetical protein
MISSPPYRRPRAGGDLYPCPGGGWKGSQPFVGTTRRDHPEERITHLCAARAINLRDTIGGLMMGSFRLLT